MLSYYHGSDPGLIIGVFGEPYDWGESGALWGSLIDYWSYTGDAQYVALVQQALLSQVGPDQDYMTPNQSRTEVVLHNDLKTTWQIKLTVIANNRETMIKQSGP